MKKIKPERILQISNDIAEHMGKHTHDELRQVILYWMNQHSKRVQEFHSFRDRQVSRQLAALNELLADKGNLK